MEKIENNEELCRLNLDTNKPTIIITCNSKNTVINNCDLVDNNEVDCIGCNTTVENNSSNNKNYNTINENNILIRTLSSLTSISPLPPSNTTNHRKPLGLRPKAIFRQVLMVMFANLAILSTGMALGYPAVTLVQLTDPKKSIHFTISQASWFASINSMSCPLGGLLSGYCLDKIGRKKTIFLINLISILSWALMTFSLEINTNVMFIQIMISRFLIGIATGLASSPVGVYSAEVCHSELRGRLTLGTSISTAAGILIIYVLGYIIQDNWRLTAGLACVLSIISFLLTIPIPESPSWLIMKGRNNEAEHSLRFFRAIKKNDQTRNINEFQTEYQHLLKSIQANSGQNKVPLSVMIKRPEMYKPLLIMIGFFAFQQFGGIFVIIVYAVQFAIEAGVTIDPIICAILIGLTRLLTTFIVGFVLDKWGRRPPAIISGTGMGICMLILSSMTWFNFTIPHLPVICIIMYIFTSTLGLMTLPFSMISEVYPQNVRGFAAGITICCAFLMSFINIKIYPNMVKIMGRENVFAFYGIVSLLAVIYIYLFLPETKGKSLSEIESYFRNENTKKNSNKNYHNIEMKEIFVKK